MLAEHLIGELAHGGSAYAGGVERVQEPFGNIGHGGLPSDDGNAGTAEPYSKSG